jgi:thiamine transport system substrate-binding protein
MSLPDPGGLSEPRLRRPGGSGRVLVSVAVAAGLVLAGVGTYEFVQSEFGGTTLVILTYSSLFGGSCGGTPAFSSVFGTFASVHGIRLDVECPPGTLYSALTAGSGAPSADLVIGLDEITAPEAEAAHLLTPYAPPELSNVSPGLVAELSPDDGVVPYEYGYLAVDYSSAFYNATAGRVAGLTFPELLRNNTSWAKYLLVEDPEYDITGEEFLVWQIEYYEHVLGQNWTEFWTGMPPGAPPLSDSWSDAFAEFQAGVDPMVVSYSTDPAYAAVTGGAGAFNATVSWWHGSEYSWRTIYGIGIVNGTRHPTLAQAFENWFLSGPVQAEIPENEWEYPANGTVALPPVFNASIPPSAIVALNGDTTPAQVGAELPGWLATWEGLTSGDG